MFAKILIANRGEIACRIVRTARRLGIRTVAVYSEADTRALHVRLADEAVLLGPAPARDSYLNIDRVVDAARGCGAAAIHPGYGFLSENGEFAAACERAGIVFVGPPPSAIRAMGSKRAAKALLEETGVPLVPGYHGDNQEPAYLKQQAERIGYPVLIKASAGGGGRGMRLVNRAGEFDNALASCRREAASSFGDDAVLLEKYIARPRHVEIQVFADRHGNCVHLFERDCSVQRRHQKVVEEAPAPGMTDGHRTAMGEAAIAVARAVGYVGAGTVEFIVGPAGDFYFMEMNTRLQVEHPVTEMVTGLDLVEWQLRVAAGEVLPLRQEQIGLRGHAIEVRVYAEDPARHFLPSPGRLVHLAAPPESPHVRIDTGVEQGDEITPHYDPMIAKLIVWDGTRERARARLLEALAEYRIVGVANNLEFLARLAATRSFIQADLDTGLIERERVDLSTSPTPPPPDVYLFAALAELLREAQARRLLLDAASDRHSPWRTSDAWRLNATGERRLLFQCGADNTEVRAVFRRSGHTLRVGSLSVNATGRLGPNDTLQADLGDEMLQGAVVPLERKRHVFLRGRAYALTYVDPLHHDFETELHEGDLRAPMPGKVTALLVKEGDAVERGAALLVLEAMKMEHTIAAPGKGKVRALNVKAGDQVVEGAELIDLELE